MLYNSTLHIILFLHSHQRSHWVSQDGFLGRLRIAEMTDKYFYRLDTLLDAKPTMSKANWK